MQPTPPASTDTTPTAPTDPTQALAAQLDDVMAQAEIAANAQRDEEAGTPPAETARQESQATEDTEDDELEDDETEGEQANPAAAAAQEAATPPTAVDTPSTDTPPGEQPKYSRRDAARFAEQATKAEREAAEARQIAATAQAELNSARAADQHILTQLAEVSGYTREANGRFKYDNLKDKVIRGTATEAERTEVAEMTQWHELAGPIYRQAELQVTRAFATDWNALKDLDGIGDKGLTELNHAPNSIAGAKKLHAMAFSAGEAKARKESEATIARLRAEVKSAKNGAVARVAQPAVANGAAIPAGTNWRDRAFGADGLPTAEFDAEVRAGKWLGVDLSST